jgi:hypothetical protein
MMMGKKGTYDVGFGKPPVHSRFKKGKSGNNDGRPSGVKNKETDDSFSKMLREEGSRFIEVKENGKHKKMPTNRAIMRAVLLAAASGKIAAQKLALTLFSKDDNRRAAENADRFNAAADFKKWWAEESKRRRLRDEPEPDFMFHPDHFHLDFKNGTVTYVGLTADQKEYFEGRTNMRGFFESSVLSLIEGPPPSGEDLITVWEDLQHSVRTLAKLYKSLGLPWATDFPDLPNLDRMDELKKRIMKDLGLNENEMS